VHARQRICIPQGTAANLCRLARKTLEEEFPFYLEKKEEEGRFERYFFRRILYWKV